MSIVKDGIYRHYKGQNYRALEIVLHSETEEELILYECLYENPKSQIWVRPLNMFLENIIVDGKCIPRFEYIGNIKGKNRL